MEWDASDKFSCVPGILLNLYDGQLSKLSVPNVSLVINKLSSSLDSNHIQEINRFSSEIPIRTRNGQMETNQNNGQSGNGSERSTQDQDFDLAKIQHLETSSEKIINLLNSQILALELLSNVIFVDEDEEEAEFEDESGDSALEDFEDSIQDESSMDVEMQEGGTGFVAEVNGSLYRIPKAHTCWSI